MTIASAEGRTADVRALVAEGAKVGDRDGSGYTPLIWAAWYGRRETVKTLLEAGADPDGRGGWPSRIPGSAWDWTALMTAIHHDHAETARALLDAGADPNAAGNDGTTALILATGDDVPASGRLELVRALLTKGADPRHQNAYGITPLGNAVEMGDTEVVRTLLEKAPDLRLDRGVAGWAAFSLARLRGRAEILGLIEEPKARRESHASEP